MRTTRSSSRRSPTTARLRGATVFIGASFGAKRDIAGDGTISHGGVIAEAIARASARAAALGADSDAASWIKVTSDANVLLDDGSLVVGDFVTLRASHEGLNFQATASASCSCGGGDTDATAKVIFHGDSHVQAGDLAVIKTAELLVEAFQVGSKLYAQARRSGGLLDGGDADADVTNDAKRSILWNAKVFLLGEPNPVLIVDATGTVVAKTYNVGVRANGVGPYLGIGDVIPVGQTIVIDPIIYDELPAATFLANHVDGVNSTIDGTTGRLLHPGDLGLGDDPERVRPAADDPRHRWQPERLDQHAERIADDVSRRRDQHLRRTTAPRRTRATSSSTSSTSSRRPTS